MSSATFKAMGGITLLLLLAAFFNGCGLYKTSSSPDQGNNSKAISGAAQIQISNFSFQPAVVRIKTGTEVTWRQQDSTRHNIKSSDPAAGLFESRNLAQGEKFEYTFLVPGTYPYHCTLHPKMIGTIIVEK